MRSLQGNLRPRPWCIDLTIARSIHEASVLDFPAMTSLSVNKWYGLLWLIMLYTDRDTRLIRLQAKQLSENRALIFSGTPPYREHPVNTTISLFHNYFVNWKSSLQNTHKLVITVVVLKKDGWEMYKDSYCAFFRSLHETLSFTTTFNIAVWLLRSHTIW